VPLNGAFGETETFYQQDKVFRIAVNRSQLLDSIKETDCKLSRAGTTLKPPTMKLAGFLLLLAGWCIVLGAVLLLSAVSMRAAFVLAGTGVEVLGLTLVVRAHLGPRVEKGYRH